MSSLKYISFSKMAPFVLLIHLLLLVSGMEGDRSSSRFRNKPCEEGFFYKRSQERCQRCSECPPRQIIVTYCTSNSDVQCGKITTFQNSEGFVLGEGGDQSNQATMEEEDQEYWKKLALALIGALSFLIVVGTIFVILAWAKVRKATIVKMPEDGDTDDADSGYVVIRSIRHMALPRSNTTTTTGLQDSDDARPPLLESESQHDSSRSGSSCLHGNLCYLPKVYKPQRRLLNYDADDVFESDDNSGYSAIPKLKSPPRQTRVRHEHER